MTKKAQAQLQKKIDKTEAEIRRKKEQLAKLRWKNPGQEVSDYLLMQGSRPVKLSQLFGKKGELILIHNMGVSCPYCTLWADGFNGILQHLQDRAAFAVESPDRPATQSAFAKKRGWKFRMVSSLGTSFRGDMGYQNKEGDPWPGVSVFTKDRGGKIRQMSNTGFGPGDNYCNLWDLFDLLPGGAGKWTAQFKY